MRDEVRRYHSLSRYVRRHFGERVHKVTLRAGFTCPNRDGTLGRGGCIFCSGRELAPASYQEEQSLAEQLESGIHRMKQRGISKVIAYFQDHTATYAPAEQLRSLFFEPLERPEVVGLAVGTRPDVVPPPVLDLFCELHEQTFFWVELGLQTVRDDLLQACNRLHTVAQFADAAQRLAQRGIRVCVHLLFGLPGEEPEDIVQACKLLEESGVWGVKLHNLLVLEGTALARRYQEGGYAPLSEEGYLEAVASCLSRLPAKMVLHRLCADAPPAQIVAPAWAQNKGQFLLALRRFLDKEDIWQGKADGTSLEELQALTG